MSLLKAKRRGSVVASVLAGSWRSHPPQPAISAEDFESVAPVLLDSPVAPLVWRQVKAHFPNCSVAPQFQTAYRLSALKAELQTRSLQEIFRRIYAAGLHAILHKGYAVSRYYPDPALRSYTDIDLFIQPGTDAAILAAVGEELQHAAHVDVEHAEIEDFDCVPWGVLYERSQVFPLGGVSIRVLSPEDQLRALCIHCLKHGVESPLWLIDIAAAAENRSPEFNWERCFGTNDLQANWVRCALTLAGTLLSADIPETGFKLPPWLPRAVLRRWSRTHIYGLPHGLAAGLRRQRGLLDAFVQCWPPGSRVCLDAGLPFTSTPVLPLQLKTIVRPGKVRTLLLQLPNLWRKSWRRTSTLHS